MRAEGFWNFNENVLHDVLFKWLDFIHNNKLWTYVLWICVLVCKHIKCNFENAFVYCQHYLSFSHKSQFHISHITINDIDVQFPIACNLCVTTHNVHIFPIYIVLAFLDMFWNWQGAFLNMTGAPWMKYTKGDNLLNTLSVCCVHLYVNHIILVLFNEIDKNTCDFFYDITTTLSGYCNVFLLFAIVAMKD